MRLSWRARLQQRSEYRDIGAWPFFDAQTLPLAQRAVFVRNHTLVAQALAGEPLGQVAAANGVSAALLTHLLTRCLGGNEDDEPCLTAALVPHARLQPGRRTSPLATLQRPRGARGAFAALLAQLPALNEGLDKVLRAAVGRRAHGQNLTPQAFHAEFLRLLREAQWPSDCYPYTEVKRGYESARRYFHQRCEMLRAPKPKPTRAIRNVTPTVGIYEELQIDEQVVDAHGRIDLALDDTPEALRVGRISLACIVDKASDARLGYQLCLTLHPSQFDLLALLAQLHTPWQPMTLTTPGLEYAPGACLPSALGFPFTHAGAGIVRFDNAFAHSALRIRDFLCRRRGDTVEFGLPAHPKARDDVEHAFDLVSDQMRRFPSTTGTHPRDPRREVRCQRTRAPCITLRALEEALSVVLTQHNVTPQARLGGRTPLQVLQAHAHDGWPRLLPDTVVQQLNPLIQRRTLPTHWLKHENRAPHVNFCYLRYHGDGLCQAALAHEAVQVEFDYRDIRSLKAYDLRGCYLGELQAPLSWQRYPHSVTTRTYIYHWMRRERLTLRDPLGGYFAHLLQRRQQPKAALEIVRVYREFNPSAIVLGAPAEPPGAPARSPSPAATRTRAIPDWSPTLVRGGTHHDPA